MPSNPINVFPNGNTVDVTASPVFNFTFTGSKLDSYWYYICTAGYTGVLLSGTQTVTGSIYNGEETSFTLPNGLVNGDNVNYTWGMVFNPQTENDKYAFKLVTIDDKEVVEKNPKATYDYFLYGRNTPTASCTIESATLSDNIYTVSKRQLNVTCTYAQAQQIQTKYFSFDLYSGDEEADIKPINLLDSTGKVFSSNVKYNYDGLINGKNYILVFNLDTQSDQTVNQIFYITAQYNPVTLEELNLQLNYNDSINAFELTWNKGAFSSPEEEGSITYFPEDNPDYSFVKVGDNSKLTYNKISGKEIAVTDENNFGFTMKFRTNIATQEIATVSVSDKDMDISFADGAVQISYDDVLITSHEMNIEWALQNYSATLSDTLYMWYEDGNHMWSNSASMWYHENEADFSADFLAIVNFVNGQCSASLFEFLQAPTLQSITGTIANVQAPYGTTGYTVYYYTGGQWNELGEGTV